MSVHFSIAQKSWPQADIDKVVKFYPNPATAYITFDFSKQPRQEEGEYVLNIYNFLGRKVFTTVVHTDKITIPLDNFFRGPYIFQIVKSQTGAVLASSKFQVNK